MKQAERTPERPADSGEAADIAILGAGLAGTLAAIVLGRAGYRIALIDPHAVYPPDFRAEKLGPKQMAIFDRIGLGREVRALTTPFEGVWVIRFGRFLTRKRGREWGFSYPVLVNGLRALLPPGVALTVGRVETIATGRERQDIGLADGRCINARLLILATGLGEAVRRKAGVEKTVRSDGHSLSLGFNLTALPSALPFASLVYCGEMFGDLVSYLTLFPIGETLRANLFVHHKATDAWTKQFRTDPTAMLQRVMPGLDRWCGTPMVVAGPVETRPIDLIAAKGHERDGVVLIGDAFATTCPITGTGIQKVAVDVERLTQVHVPRWFATPGMGAEKIRTFYADRVKLRNDQRALRRSLVARAMIADHGRAWQLRRWRNNAIRLGLYGMAQARERIERLMGPRRNA